MHPWVWLNEPQHSSAISALTSCIGTAVAFAAFFFAVRAYRATTEQLGITKRQLRDGQRPFLLVELDTDSGKLQPQHQRFVVKNKGSGIVVESYWIREHDLEHAKRMAQAPSWVRIGSISKEGSALLLLSNGGALGSGYRGTIYIHFSDTEGVRYRCTAIQHPAGIDNHNEELAPLIETPLVRSR